MAQIFLQGNPIIETYAELPPVGSIAPDFTLTSLDLSSSSLADYRGKRIILNIFPSVDTQTCGLSVKAFHQAASTLKNTVVLCISRDLPFAQSRFCAAEGIENIYMLSEYQNSHFSEIYGVLMTVGPLTGLLSRAIVVIDEIGSIVYTEQVADISSEPDYEKALAFLK